MSIKSALRGFASYAASNMAIAPVSAKDFADFHVDMDKTR